MLDEFKHHVENLAFKAIRGRWRLEDSPPPAQPMAYLNNISNYVASPAERIVNAQGHGAQAGLNPMGPTGYMHAAPKNGGQGGKDVFLTNTGGSFFHELSQDTL